MLTHYGNFLCSIGEKGSFKTIFSQWCSALSGVFFTTQVYKPGSVLTVIYLVPQLLTESSHLLEAVG